MKVSEKQFNAIKNLVRKNLSKNDPWHDVHHTEQTAKLAKALAKKEKADVNKCIVAAWLHDICKRHEAKQIDHGKEASKRARLFLTEIGFDKKDVQEICYAIYEHNKGGEKKTKEAAILWDADKLQGIGPYGIIRGGGFLASIGKTQKEVYKKAKEEQEFFSKRFHTKTGKKIATESQKWMKKFEKSYVKILNAKL